MASIRFDASFGSHMVLQRGPSHAAVYGLVDGNHAPTVRVALSPRGTSALVQEVAAVVSPDRDRVAGGRNDTRARRWRWRAELQPVSGLGHGTFYSVTATSSANATAHMHSVTFGDVWVCAG